MKNKLGLIKFWNHDKSTTKITPEDRLSILKVVAREGQASTIRKYQIAPSIYARWKRKYLQEGITVLKDKHKRVDPEIRALEIENEKLRTGLFWHQQQFYY